MVTFGLHLGRAKRQCNTGIGFDLRGLGDPEVAEIFRAGMGWRFAALSILDSGMGVDMLTDTFHTAVTDTANEILGKYHPVKKSWVTTDILDLCAKQGKLKNKKEQRITSSKLSETINLD